MRVRISSAFVLLVCVALGLSETTGLAEGRASLSSSMTPQQEGQNVELVGHFGGYTFAVAVKGNYAYTVNGGGLRVVDVSDPTEPKEAGFCGTPGDAQEVTVAGDYAYTGEEGDPTGSMSIINVSDPLSPAATGVYVTSGHIYDVAVDGEYA
jgi:hypothetical protein